MKKLLLFSVACFSICFCAYGAPAGVGAYAELGRAMQLQPNIKVTPKGCPTSEPTNCNRNDNEILQLYGVNGCFICEQNYCNSGVFVSFRGTAEVRGGGGKRYSGFHSFVCKRGGAFYDDHWSHVDLNECTSNKFLRLKNDPNAIQVIINPDTGEASVNDQASYVMSATAACIGYVCGSDFVEVNGKCMPKNAEIDFGAKCEESGGSWSIDSSSCSCDSNKNLKEQNGVCVCISDDYTYSESDKKCIKKADNGGGTPGGGENPGRVNPTCTERYGCYSLPADKQKACVACCSVSSAIANWNPGTQICECVNKSQTFNPDTKMCSGVVVNPPVVTEPETYRCDLNKLLELRNKYSNNSEVVRLIDDLIKKCNEGISETEYNNLYVNINIMITNIQNTTISSSNTKISNAVAKLNKIASDFNTSVWKNAEGEFNTSRLISDSVAGVVLGTAGGLITSSVVKKNQVESGFEDIQCTVGGQVVAGWGDQFRVGIQ